MIGYRVGTQSTLHLPRKVGKRKESQDLYCDSEPRTKLTGGLCGECKLGSDKEFGLVLVKKRTKNDPKRVVCLLGKKSR